MRLFLAILLLLTACGDQVESDGVDASAEIELPRFPLPAPKPSTRTNIDRALFGKPETLGDIASRLEAALDRSGYEDFSYYEVPDGFALITETERIHDDGRPYDGNERWQFQPVPLVSVGTLFEEGFPRGFLNRLRNADPGRYRVLVFLVTTKAVTTGNEAVDFETAETWTEGGGDFLPPLISMQRLTPSHNISVLIYEFRRASVSADPDFLDPSGLTARRHLQATGLLRGVSR